ncbi:MAG: DinB family protein [Deltaproteobacteria bacterium]|nr:DinB family protein [Deltaproteobacteria bacterium]
MIPFGIQDDRISMDGTIERWAARITDATLAGILEYMSIVNPAPRRYDYWLAVTHFFNHHTHHRGQLTTLLSQCGKDYGVTDLISLPGVQNRGQA